MDELAIAIEKAVQAYKNEYGENEKMEDGEEVYAVFNDGVIRLLREGSELKIGVVMGKPYIFSENIFKE